MWVFFFSFSFPFFFFYLFVFHTEASHTVTQSFQRARIHPKGLFFKIPLLCCPPFYFADSVLLLVFLQIILTILTCRPLLSHSDHVPQMSQLIFWWRKKTFTVQGWFLGGHFLPLFFPHPHFTAVPPFSHSFIHQLTHIHTHSHSAAGFMMPDGSVNEPVSEISDLRVQYWCREKPELQTHESADCSAGILYCGAGHTGDLSSERVHRKDTLTRYLCSVNVHIHYICKKCLSQFYRELISIW